MGKDQVMFSIYYVTIIHAADEKVNWAGTGEKNRKDGAGQHSVWADKDQRSRLSCV